MPVAPNLLDGNLSPPEPNQAWTSEGWLYLAVVIGTFAVFSGTLLLTVMGYDSHKAGR